MLAREHAGDVALRCQAFAGTAWRGFPYWELTRAFSSLIDCARQWASPQEWVHEQARGDTQSGADVS